MKVIYSLQDPVSDERETFPSVESFLADSRGRMFHSVFSDGREDYESKLTLEVPSLALSFEIELKEGENESE